MDTMWTCPDCQRDFARTAQHHFCTAQIDTVDAYIEAAPEQHRERLRQVREVIRAAAPDADERMAWKMPTYRAGRNLIHFAAAAGHLGIYPGADGVAHFVNQLDEMGLAHAKGTIRIPWDAAPFPLNLIREITQYRVLVEASRAA